ncbi:unnamed protein product [Caenorhabditis angaria]|uniref:WAP domain-containing protein n=1 Tax=Caenorhabditis angaria TaxID=860376 RepID=A0A9P1N927_9PELO|nr:unnamed protein product [Caenorhabditis angaria]
MKSSKWLFFSFFLTQIYISGTFMSPTSIDWCRYFQRLHIYKPECKFYDGQIVETAIQAPKAYPLARINIPQCSAHYMYCTTNNQCGPGYLRCIDMTKYRECCAPFKRQCPPIDYLSFRCVVRDPNGWCSKDSDCSSTSNKLCCPTGCNYNICV